ncbi:MAG TPA: proprotein convertase P-domain-containing protein, partial [Thermoanaerobaculia bacterium]
MRLLLGILLFSLTTQLAAQRDLRLELVRDSLTGTHCRYREYVAGLPTDYWVTQPCAPQRQGELSIVTRQPLTHEGRRFVEGRVIRRVIVEEAPLQPYLHDYDDATGELLRRVPFFHRSRAARVFDPNPVVTLNDPGLQNQNDSPFAVPPSAYHDVELRDVAESGPLRGPHVTIVDRQAPAIAPADASGSLLFDRSEPGFEDVNAYFHVDRNQRHLQALGYTGSRRVVPYSIEIDTHAAGGADNSFFLPSPPRPGYGTLYFGTGGTDDAEDADLIVHEYGHAILEWISPGTFGGSFASQSRALGEGFGDYWSYGAHYEARLASGRDLFCLADWDARCWLDAPESGCVYPPGSDCLRRVDSPKTMSDYEMGDSAGLEHRNGAIWASALREIHQALVARHGTTEGRRISDSIVVESMFGAPPQPSFAAIARQMLEADRLLTGGLHRAPICAAMTSRSILSSCDDYPRGEFTLVQSSGRGLPIPENTAAGVISLLTINDTRSIERLLVRVDIAHPSRGDLRIELIAPDGTTVVLQPLSLDRTADVRVTFGLTATPLESLDIFRGRSAAGVWQLVVRDLRPLDIGTLLSWGLMIQFEGDDPLASRPRVGPAQVVPVVANVFGAGMTRYLSDVRIANRGTEARLATLV